MKNLLLPGITIMLMALASTVAFSQQPQSFVKPSTTSTSQSKTPCSKAVATAKKQAQTEANASCQTVYYCVECVDDKSKKQTCERIVVQPSKKGCPNAIQVLEPAQSQPVKSNAVSDLFEVDIFQSPCYAGGVTLEAVVVNDGHGGPDGKSLNADYTYLWEVDGGKGGHARIINCVEASTAKVRVTKRSTGESVSMSVRMNSGPATSSATSRPALPNDLVFSYRTTSCYGTCPVYEVNIYDNGTITWNGIANVGTMGSSKMKIEQSVIERMKKDARSLGFFSLKDRYPDYPVWDAPSTIMYINGSGEDRNEVSVSAAELSPPKAFTALHGQIQELIVKYGWKVEKSGSTKIMQDTGVPQKRRN